MFSKEELRKWIVRSRHRPGGGGRIGDHGQFGNGGSPAKTKNNCKALGARAMRQWTTYRLDGEALKALAGVTETERRGE